MHTATWNSTHHGQPGYSPLWVLKVSATETPTKPLIRLHSPGWSGNSLAVGWLPWAAFIKEAAAFCPSLNSKIVTLSTNYANQLTSCVSWGFFRESLPARGSHQMWPLSLGLTSWYKLSAYYRKKYIYFLYKWPNILYPVIRKKGLLRKLVIKINVNYSVKTTIHGHTEYLIYHPGISHSIASEQGPHFTDREGQKWAHAQKLQWVYHVVCNPEATVSVKLQNVLWRLRFQHLLGDSTLGDCCKVL